MKIYVAQINPTIGDFEGNSALIRAHLQNAKKQGAKLALFPEMALTGYPPDDLLNQRHFLEKMQTTLNNLVQETKGITAIIGTPRGNPRERGKHLHNSAAIITDGELVGFHDKMLLPTYDVFDEHRYFEPGTAITTWTIDGCSVGVTICEDLWEHSQQLTHTSYTRNPVLELEEKRPSLIVNLSASPYCVGRFHHRLQVTSNAAKTLGCPVILCNQVGGNDSLIFDGYSHAVNEKGELIYHAAPFQEDAFLLDLADLPPPMLLFS